MLLILLFSVLSLSLFLLLPSYSNAYINTNTNPPKLKLKLKLSLSPHLEVIRFRAYSLLRKKLAYLVKEKENVDSRRGWLKVFERWQMLSKIDNAGEQQRDPLLPDTTAISIHTALVSELSLLEGMSPDAAHRVAVEIEKYSNQLVEGIVKATDSLKNRQPNSNSNSKLEELVQVSKIKRKVYERATKETAGLPRKEDFIYQLSLKVTSDALVSSSLLQEINEHNANKLYNMWLAKGQGQGQDLEKELELDMTSTSTSTSTCTSMSPKFWQDCYCLLLRYKALEGFGYQAGITTSSFECLQDIFQVSTECFASPLNKYAGTYCSAFPDTDSVFGSQGSFFNEAFSPKEGSYQANPPFSTEVMKRALDKITLLLDNAQGPMSFVVVLPAWTEEPFWQELQQNPYLRTTLVVDTNEYCYSDGMAYFIKGSNSNRLAAFPTGLLFLQNEGGFAKFTPTEEKIGLLREALLVGVEAGWDVPVAYTPKRYDSGNGSGS